MRPMMLRRIFKALFPLILGILICTVVFISCAPRKRVNVTPFDAVPSSSPLFIKVNNVVKLTQLLNDENEWWGILGKIGKVASLQQNLKSLRSNIEKSSDFKKVVEGKEIIVSLHPDANNEVNTLVIVPLNIGDQGLAENFIEAFTKENSLVVNKRKFDKVPVFELSGTIHRSYSFFQDLLLYSSQTSLVEDAITKLKSGFHPENPALTSLLKTMNHQSELNIFIDHKNADGIFSSLLSDPMKAKASLLKNYSEWTELDATIKDGKIFLSGFSNADPQQNFFSNILLKQQPGVSTIESVLPSSVDFFSSFYISDLEKFFMDYSAFQNGNDQNALNQLKEVQGKTGFDLKELFVELFDKEIARSSVRFDLENPGPYNVLTVKTKSGSYTLKRLKDLQDAYFKPTKKTASQYEKVFKIDNQIKIQIGRFPVENMPAFLFGNLFPNVKTCWYTVYENYLFFSDSYNALGKVVCSIVLGETLGLDKEYVKFQSGLASNSNFTFFCNSSAAFNESNLFFSNDIADDITYDSDFGKFKYLVWQVSSSGSMVYNNACLFYSPELKVKPKTVWQSNLSSAVVKKPLIIENRYDSQENEIVLVDSKNNVSFLNSIGRVVWQINTDSPVLGDIHLVDLKKSGDYELVFNTNEKLFVIDKNGKNRKNYPVKFKVNATSGVSVFDYEKNRNYRFFVAAEDQKIYAYESDGTILEGWQPPKTDHVVTQPIQHFVDDGKDYIVASDPMKDYIFDRKGNIRVHTDYVFQHSANNPLYFEKRTSSHKARLVTTDSNGNIHHVYFDGKHDKEESGPFDDTHYFVADNIDGDDEMEYIFVQGKRIFVEKSNGTVLFDQTIDNAITNRPGIFKFSKNEKKIGVTCGIAEKIYLFDSKGTLQPNFPMEGNSEFAVGLIGDDQSSFNLLVGSSGGYLYNYLVK